MTHWIFVLLSQRRSAHIYRSVFLLAVGICIGYNIHSFVALWKSKHILNNHNGINARIVETGQKMHEAVRSKLFNLPKQEIKVNDKSTPSGPYDGLPNNFLVDVKQHKATERFIITPGLDLGKERIFMLFLVKSACHRADRRNLVRSNWGSIRYINNKRIVVIFVVGRTTPEEQPMLLRESKENQDILQADVSDEYRFLPDKVLTAYQWIAEEMHDISDFYVFTDDDCSINLPNTFDYFSTNEQLLKGNKTLYCGWGYGQEHMPYRDTANKYHVSEDVYSKSLYPPFCHGGMTVLAYDILRDIYQVSEITDRSGFHLEDVYVNGILRDKLGNGMKNIKEVGFDGTKDNLSNKLDKLVVHIGDNQFRAMAFKIDWTEQVVTMMVNGGDTIIPPKIIKENSLQAVVDKNGIDLQFFSGWNPNQDAVQLLLKRAVGLD